MTLAADLWGNDALRNLRQTSEAQGFDFYINPSRDIVPGFLGGFRPDAIARSANGGIVIEVVAGRNPGSERQLAYISNLVSQQKGWEFRAVFLNPPLDETPPIAKPTAPQIEAALAEVGALNEAGHHGAAFVIAWAVLEALARLAHATGDSGTLKAVSALQAIQTLAEEGYLENDAADRLRQMVKLRNAVVHGDLSIDISAQTAEDLVGMLRGIASEIETVRA